jgi:ubiquinone/menaquinone biosynthesis C-methylase UbiE
MLDSIRGSFDAIADHYARDFAAELDRKPFDREVLTQFAAGAEPGAVALDLGCGAAGHVGGFLHERGLSVTGVDISARSIELARALNPTMSFVVADFRWLPIDANSVDAICAFYAFIYGSDEDVLAALKEAARVLRPGGRLLAAVHGSLDGTAREESFKDYKGIPIDITVRYTTPAAFASLAEQAGLVIRELRARDPYEDEHRSLRIYLLAESAA